MKLSKEDIAYQAGRSAVLERENNMLAFKQNIATGNSEFHRYWRAAAKVPRVRARVTVPFVVAGGRLAEVNEIVELDPFDAKSIAAIGWCVVIEC